MAYEGTPAAEWVEAYVLHRFGSAVEKVGQYNRRPIAGTSSWSQHSWGNAIDFHVTPDGSKATGQAKANGDAIAAYLRENKTRFGIRTILWWTTDHWDHIHVDMWPKGVGTPPLSSTGTGTFQYSNGSRLSARIQLVPPEREVEEDMSIVITVLKGQNMAFYRSLQAKTGVPVGNADYWGSDYTGSPRPTQAEWEAAADDLFGAALQVGVFAAVSTVDAVARAGVTAVQSRVTNLVNYLRKSPS